MDVIASNSQYISQDSAASESGVGGDGVRGGLNSAAVMHQSPGSAQELSSPANSSSMSGSNKSSFNQSDHTRGNVMHVPRSKDKRRVNETTIGEREMAVSGEDRRVSKRPSKNQRNELAEATSQAIGKEYEKNADCDDSNKLPRELLELDSMLAEMGTISPCNTIGTESATSNTIKDENKTLEAPSGCTSNQGSASVGDQKVAREILPGNTFSRRQRPVEMPDDCPANLKAVFSPN